LATVASLATVDDEVVGAALSTGVGRGVRWVVAVFLGHDNEQTSRLAATVAEPLSADRLARTEPVCLT